MRRNAYLGPESLTYAENSAGYVYITIPESPLKPGFVRKLADTAPAIERVWAKLDAQERAAAERMNETLYLQRVERMKRTRAFLQSRLHASDCSAVEADLVTGMLGVLDRKENLLQRNSVYGVAAMQEREAPLAPSRPVAAIVKETA